MRRTEQQWRALFQLQRDSDLSIKEFCLKNGISASSFYKHKAILITHSKAALPSPFSQVTLIEPETVVATHVINLCVGKVNMTFDSHTDIHWLSSLVRQLV